MYIPLSAYGIGVAANIVPVDTLCKQELIYNKLIKLNIFYIGKSVLNL